MDTVDMVPMCQTVSCVTRIEPDESSDTSGTDTAVINGSDIEDFCQWPELSEEEDCFGSDVGSSVDSSLCISEQDDLSYADVASVVDFDSEDSDVDFCFNSEEGSVAELEWNTWDETCALEFQNASGIFLPDSAVVRRAVNIKDNIYNMEDGGHPAWDVCCTGLAIDTHGYVGYVDGDISIACLCLLGRSGVENIMQRRLNHRHTVSWDPGVADSRPLAVCYDCLCLIYLFLTVMSLSYDWDEVFGWIGHDEGYDCSPAGALGYLPWCLYSPLVMDRMTQYLTEIKVPGWSLVLSETMYTSARRCVCTRGTPQGVFFSAGRISLALIGHRASVGSSVGCDDWSRMDGAVDISPGGFWIDYIMPGLEDGQSIVAAPVTGSLVSSTLFSCRDFCTAGYTLNWTFCGTSSEVMRVVHGRRPFPANAMHQVMPPYRVRWAAHYMTAMGLWRPPTTSEIRGPLPLATCNACMLCSDCFPDVPQ